MDEKDITGFYKLLIHAILEQVWRIIWAGVLLGLGAWAAFGWLSQEENTTQREKEGLVKSDERTE